MQRLKIILRSNLLYKVTALIVLLFSLMITLIPKYKSVYKINTKEFTCKLIDYSIDGNELKMDLKCKENIIAKYYFKEESEKEEFSKKAKLGSKIKLYGELTKPKNNTVPYLFNYKKYLYNRKIYYILNADKIKLLNAKLNIFYKLKNIMYNHTNRIKHNEYVYAYILGKTTKIDDEVINSYRINGISHLFALSGLHTGVFSLIILNLLKKLKLKEIKVYTITFIFLIIFSFITGLSPSILRASILFFLISINKIYKLNIKTIDLLYITFSLLLIFNPFILYNISFILSFISTYFIILITTNKKDNYIVSLLKVSTLSFISSAGVSIYYFGFISPLGILNNLVFVPLITFIIFPLVILTYIFTFLSPIVYLLTTFMETMSLKISSLMKIIYFPHISVLEVIAYYILLLSIIKTKNKKIILIFLILVLYWKTKPLFDSSTSIYYIDVGQGDSILLVTPHKKTTILIDTGGKINYKTEKWKEKSKKYSLGKDTLIPFMRKIGVNKLDYLILTHGDFDHMGEGVNIVNNFKVEKVLFNFGEYNKLEESLIKVLNKKKIQYSSSLKELNINDHILYFLNNKDYGNENDNSKVIYTELNNYRFLFMADASINVEKDLIKKYKLKNIDVLKVGHHGSKTSSSKEFIKAVNPKYSIISVGSNNRYGHPNNEALNNLKKSKIYRTDKNGSIIFKIKKNKLKIITYMP